MVGPGIQQKNTEKRGKWDTNTVGPRIWRETLKNVENEKYTQQTWTMARKLKKVENETQTLFDLEYGKKHSKMWKMTNTQCRTWMMARKLKNVENGTQTL